MFNSKMRWLYFLLFLGLYSVDGLSFSGNRLLVVLEDLSEQDRYSTFFKDLKERGFEISYESPKKEELALIKLGERIYDHLIIFPTKSKGLGPNLTPQIILNFINAKGNVLIALSSIQSAPSGLVSLLLELDIHLPSDRNSLVVDHFNYDTLSAPEKHDVVLVSKPDALRADVKNYFKSESKGERYIAFPRGIGHILGNDSPFLTPVLRAPRTAYCYSPKTEEDGVEEPFATGQQLELVSAMQARNSARLTVIGAAEMLEDKWFDANVKRIPGSGPGPKEVKTANRAFAKEISGWTFNEIGVLKVGNIEHHLSDVVGSKYNETNPKIYRVKNKVTYSIELSEYSWDKFIPYRLESEDNIQLEFSMLSPFHRLSLEPSAYTTNSTWYRTSFTIPDQHGIFNFMVDYKRPFLSNVEEKNTVTVRHFAHDEWPRSWTITAAWPWIMGIVVTVMGWVTFVAIWLWSAPAPPKLASGKKVQ